MDQLLVYWKKIKDGFWSLISRIESSVVFERIVSKYEALPTRNQKTIKSLATILVTIMVAWFVLAPLVRTRLNFSQNRSFFSLVSSMKLFNSKLESSRKEYLPPVGWQNIPADDLSQLEDSISNLMAGLGLAETQYEVAPQGATLLVHASEATIKQLESFMFEMDGLYPRYSVVRSKTTRHPENKELIQFEIEIAPGEVQDSSQALNDSEEEADLTTPDFETEDDGAPIKNNGRLNLPPSGARARSLPDRQSSPDGSVPGFDAPTFTPLDDESSDEFNPSNPSDRGGGGDSSEFVPPMGDDFIPPPPPNPNDDTFDMIPIPEDDDLPPGPPIE